MLLLSLLGGLSRGAGSRQELPLIVTEHTEESMQQCRQRQHAEISCCCSNDECGEGMMLGK